MCICAGISVVGFNMKITCAYISGVGPEELEVGSCVWSNVTAVFEQASVLPARLT